MPLSSTVIGIGEHVEWSSVGSGTCSAQLRSRSRENVTASPSPLAFKFPTHWKQKQDDDTRVKNITPRGV